ncbi:protein kinase domain-containing protein, partial [Streptomyces viridiviolaceus]
MSDGGDGRGSEGRLVGGRYRLIERIGSGGMGTVWRALDERVEREVAVKEPRLPGGPGDESHRRAAHRLYREARAAARVDHPAAVSIHDVVVEEPGLQGTTGPDGSPAPPGPDGLPWIVMELVRGESLHDRLRRGPLPAAEAAGIGRAVLGALRAAHAVGIVHRDVKPANVLLGPHGRVVLTDFGIAHVQGEESLTVSGEFVGSLEFVAPERMSGRIAGPASDLWSLGVLLYAAVEGWSPFRRTTLESTLAAVLAADPPEPVNAGPLGPLIVRLLAKEPGQRPSAEEVAKGLDGATGEWPTPEPGPTQPQRPDEMRDSAHDTGTVRLTPEATHPGPDAEARSEDPRPHITGVGERPSDAVAVRDEGSAADVADRRGGGLPWDVARLRDGGLPSDVADRRDGGSPWDVARLRDGGLPSDVAAVRDGHSPSDVAAAPEKPGAAAGPSPEGRRPARTGADLPPQAPRRRPVAPAQQPGPAPAAAEAPSTALPPVAAEAPRTAPAPVAAEESSASVPAAAEESRASVTAAAEGPRTAPVPAAAEGPRTASAPAEEP